METAIAGFGLGLSLIVAIGAQNAFVLRQGLSGQHILPIVLVCAFSDALLIAVGVAGFGILVQQVPLLEPVMRYGGAAFLLWYGARSFRAAWKGGAAMAKGRSSAPGLFSALVTCLLFTWANPHVYLDTVVLLGSVASQYDDKLSFGAGAVLASFVFFFALGYGARLLAPLFEKPRAWQVLDVGIGGIMWAIALSLLTQG